MAKEGMPRLILNAFCTTCGSICEEDQSVAVAQYALDHVAETEHVVVLNGTADVVRDSDEIDPVTHPSDEHPYAPSTGTRLMSSDAR